MSEVFEEENVQESDDSTATQTIPEKVQVDGEEIDIRQAIADHRNKKEWQRSQTQRDQEIAAQRKEVNDLLGKVIDQVAPNNAQAVANTDSSFDLDGMLEKIPDPIEDEKGYKAAMAQVLKDYGSALKNEIASQTNNLKTDTQKQIQSQSQKDRIVQDNLRMVRDYVAKTLGDDVTETDVNDVIKRVGQKWGPEYGTEDASGAFRYNEHAVEEALWGVPALRTRLIASQTNEARKEGLTGRQKGQQGSPSANRAVARPTNNAPIGDKIEWLRSLGEDEMGRAVSRMNPDERNNMLRALYNGS
tara:strand:+ start:4238 stop:5143 length:906 start_codon:yes stop_codon:yes gene_type:complete